MSDLNLDDVNLDDIDVSDLDNQDLENYGEVDETIDKPHIKVSSKDFKEMLKVAKTVISSSARDAVSKSVCIVPDKDVATCYATDFNTYIGYQLEVLNTENLLQEAVVIPVDILVKVTKAVPANTIIYKDGDNVFIKLVGGDLVLESHSVDKEKFILDKPTKNETSVSASALYSVIKDFTPLVQSAVAPLEKRVLFDNDKAVASYVWSIIISEGSFSPMDIKVKDINVLKPLLSGLDEDLLVSDVDDQVQRKQIKGSNFTYSFLVTEAKPNEVLMNQVDQVINGSGVYVDLVTLYKMVELSSDLPYSVGKLEFNYSEDGVNLVMLTKKEKNSVFNLTGSVEGNCKALKSSLVVQSKLLRLILKSFSSESSVKLSISSKGLGVSTSAYTAVLYSEGKPSK